MRENTSKSNTTTQKMQYNQLVVRRLMEKYGLSKYFIQQSIRRERQSETSEKICKDYSAMCREVDAALNK